MSKKYINTLDFYGYGENNRMEPVPSKGYKVKVSDKDGNIITIEKDDSLYACVKLAFDTNSGILSLLDAAHNDSVLAEVEMPNADYIYNCRFDEELNAILFDVKSLYGNDTDTIELYVESLVELYEAGQGIEIGEKNEETGRKPISVKLAEGEELLTLTDDGLGLDGKIVTEDELEAALSGKADVEWVEEMLSGFSGVTEIIELVEEHEEEIEKLKRIVGTDEEVPSLFEQIEDNREDIAQIDDEIGELSGTVATLEEDVETVEDNLFTMSGDVETLKDALDEEIARAKSAETDLQAAIDEEAGRAISAETALGERIDNEKAARIYWDGEIKQMVLDEEAARKAGAVASVDYDSSAKTINFFNANDEVIDSIDATDFIKDGMIDSVVLETVDNTTYLVITWNTDAGKEVTRIDIGDLFEADNYYTKEEIDTTVQGLREMDAALANVDTQQWAVINQNRQDMETVDGQLWAAITAEGDARTAADEALQSQFDVEKEEREAADTALRNDLTAETQARINGDNAISGLIDSKVAEERTRAQQAEDLLRNDLTAEVQRATREEARIENKYADDITDLQNADRALRQYINDQDAIINHRVDGLVSDLEVEQNARQTKDLELSNEIHDIRANYATKNYVDTRDNQVKDEAISVSLSSAKTYTDIEIDSAKVLLKQYCDNEHQELLEGISENTTKINKISNLNTKPDGSYSDTGNGILDVLHREFHYHIEHDGAIKEIKYENGNLIIIYDTPFGEKETVIPVSSIVDLSNYYTKEEVDDKVNDFSADLQELIDNEVQRATNAEESINNRIDNLVLECGIY